MLALSISLNSYENNADTTELNDGECDYFQQLHYSVGKQG